jgi:hypothetical protein
MEAERPMQNDERDDRDRPPDEAPPDEDADQDVEPEGVSEGDQADAAEEFETASWPVQDRSSADEQTVADAGEEPVADAVEPPAVDGSGPPPPEVEAYAPTGEAAVAGAAIPAHSVPATTEPGESTRCPRCGTENRPGIAFCQNCGQRLIAAGAPATVERPAAPDGTQACPRCGTHNRAGVAFCQNCGANLRPVEPGEVAAAEAEAVPSGHAVLGPVVLLIGAVGIATAWLLPFLGNTSLYDRAFGDPSGYGVAFWTGYGETTGLAAQAYFGFAAPAPILVLLLAALAIGGVVRARAGGLQVLGLAAALAWAVGLVALFVVVEALGSGGSDLLQMLAGLSPAGIIFALASLIVAIGCLTRFGRG